MKYNCNCLCLINWNTASQVETVDVGGGFPSCFLPLSNRVLLKRKKNKIKKNTKPNHFKGRTFT